MTQKRNSGPERREGRGGTARAREARIDELIEEATVDCNDESEQLMGFHSMLEEHLKVPFATQVLGVDVTVEGIPDLLTYAPLKMSAFCLRSPA